MLSFHQVNSSEDDNAIDVYYKIAEQVHIT